METFTKMKQLLLFVYLESLNFFLVGILVCVLGAGTEGFASETLVLSFRWLR